MEMNARIGPNGKLYCTVLKIMQFMLGHFPYLFDNWADPVVHLLLLKRSKGEVSQ